ncbi:MAG: DUF5683 domain-containing protein [Imperialibacter sp.]|uniref:DUF5683 domain-containing protein n=1 Tax=Imperialibacter sp. TaxID=2038411 RepID=UPI0032F00B52
MFRKEALKLIAATPAWRGISLAALLLFLCQFVQAQEISGDSVEVITGEPLIIRGDSVSNLPKGIMLEEELSTLDPQKAAMLSAIFPGMGQAYVGQIWKVPVYYGAFIVLGHMIYTNNRLYNIFRQSLFAEVDEDPNTINPFPRFNETALRRNTDSFRRNRDYMIVISGVVYMLNIVDAHIAAHLDEFDINDELVINYTPTIGNINGYAYAGLGIKISF